MIGVLVSGSGTNLQALLDARLPLVAVASNRPNVLALRRADSAGVPTAVFELDAFSARADRDLAMARWLESQGVELVVCAGYMHLLTPAFLERFPGRVINVHPSLLPAFPGANAIEDVLAAGARTTGATVHLVDDGVDTGFVIEQRVVEINPGDTPETLRVRIQRVEHELLPAVTRRLFEEIRSEEAQ